MTIEAINGSSATSLYAAQNTEPRKQVMDGEMFLSLLVTQLRNQDPSSPMDTNQMISQTTQLAMMEQITALTDTGRENFSLQMRTSAAALLGREVSYTGTDGNSLTGIATSVSYDGPVPQVTVNGVSIPLDAISAITANLSA